MGRPIRDLSSGWNPRAFYRCALGINLILHLVIGLSCIFLPRLVADLFGLPDPIPSGWTRGWGAMLILVTALYVPGWLEPEKRMSPNVVGIVGRVWMGTIWIFCGGGFLLFAAFDYVSAIVIGLLYWRLLRAGRAI